MKKHSGFGCMECGKVFRTIKAAEKASSVGCPKCGGVDIDLTGFETVVLPDGTPMSVRPNRDPILADFDAILALTPSVSR